MSIPETGLSAIAGILDEALLRDIERLARRFTSYDGMARELSRETVQRAAAEARPGLDRKALRLMAFRLMREAVMARGAAR